MILHLFLQLIALNLVGLQATTTDPLLVMGQNFDCIKEVIEKFIQKQTCQDLKESQKIILAVQMSNCLNIKMGKPTILQCNDFKTCQIQGDNWQFFPYQRNTFTTFFTHIDNLCHFYWDLLHHQRTQKLVLSLSESAILAENILKQNYKSTEKILETQAKIHSFMEESLASNKQLLESLNSSEKKLQNMTQNIEGFLNNLNQKIFAQYSSISKAMQTINEGIDGLSNVQSFMMSEISSMSGIIYFCLLFLVVFLLTSFDHLRKSRMQGFFILSINILVELLAPYSILVLIGTRSIRIVFGVGIIVILLKQFFSKQTQTDKLNRQINWRLQTKRLKRIFKQLLDEKQLVLPEQKQD